MRFRLLTYNIWVGGQGRAEHIARVIDSCRPDVVLLQEATRRAVIERIAALTGMIDWGAHDGRSLGYLSRTPVAHAAWHRPRLSRHAFLEIVPGFARIHLFGVHLSAVHSAFTEHRRLWELRSLLKGVRAREPGFHVLAGDFNTLAPGATLDLKRLPFRLRPMLWASGGRVRWRTIKTVLDAGYVDAYRTCHPDRPGYTMPTWDPHVRLDYAFAPASDSDRILSCDVVRHHDVSAASDHAPVMAEFEVEPAADAQVNNPKRIVQAGGRRVDERQGGRVAGPG